MLFLSLSTLWAQPIIYINMIEKKSKVAH